MALFICLFQPLFQSLRMRDELHPCFAFKGTGSAVINLYFFQYASSLENRFAIRPWFEGGVLRIEVPDKHLESCVFLHWGRIALL